jgi:hypothetical protein
MFALLVFSQVEEMSHKSAGNLSRRSDHRSSSGSPRLERRSENRRPAVHAHGQRGDTVHIAVIIGIDEGLVRPSACDRQ